jgi:hypothetical protein
MKSVIYWVGLAVALFAYDPALATPTDFDPSAYPDAPPKLYADKGACPFEGCTYGTWTVKKRTDTFDKPNGHKVGHLMPKEVVHVVTGTVYTVPTKVKILVTNTNDKGTTYTAGDSLFLLTYIGEGYHKIWYKGVIAEEFVGFLYNELDSNHDCNPPSADCWFRIEKDHRMEGGWWVQIQVKGKVVWAEVDTHGSNFSGNDSLG